MIYKILGLVLITPVIAIVILAIIDSDKDELIGALIAGVLLTLVSASYYLWFK